MIYIESSETLLLCFSDFTYRSFSKWLRKALWRSDEIEVVWISGDSLEEMSIAGLPMNISNNENIEMKIKFAYNAISLSVNSFKFSLETILLGSSHLRFSSIKELRTEFPSKHSVKTLYNMRL